MAANKRHRAAAGAVTDEGTQRSARKKRARLTLELPAELVEEVRDAAFWLSGPPNQLTIAAIAEHALANELDRIKRLHNEGKSFRPRTGNLKPGRPIGS